MIVHPGHLELTLEVFVHRQSYAAATVMDWTRLRFAEKCRGHSAGVAWVANFNNGNCNHNHVTNNNYVRVVR